MVLKPGGELAPQAIYNVGWLAIFLNLPGVAGGHFFRL